jgi:hypothetical protein
MLTTKTFEVIAKVVSEWERESVTHNYVRPTLAERFANELERHNPTFDREYFLSECKRTPNKRTHNEHYN